LQRLLREAPHESVGNYVDTAIEPVDPESHLSDVARRMAAYDILALPVVDSGHQLRGAISIDDVLDHILPRDWREHIEKEHSAGGSDG